MTKLFRQAADEFGKTVILVLHDIDFASCYSDRIVAMRDGRVVHQGPPDQIIHPDVIGDIYGIDAAVREISGQRIAYYYR